MKNVIRHILIILCIVSVASLLAGCGQSAQQDSTVKPSSDAITGSAVKQPATTTKAAVKTGPIVCKEDLDCGNQEVIDKRCQQNMAVHRIKTPTCQNPGTPESVCKDEVQEVLITCGTGIGSCSRGECQKNLYCKDQDEGKDYEMKTKTFTEIDSKEDYCKDTKILVEYYCEGTVRNSVEHKCSGKCMNGACW